jgi:putative DNA primase/helicase
MIKAITAVDPPTIENIPGQLTERPQWVCWRLETRDGKPTKVPYTPGTERRASSTDLMTWSTFDQALAAYEAGEPPYDGIGFVFCSADPFVGIDLDKCRDPERGGCAVGAEYHHPRAGGLRRGLAFRDGRPYHRRGHGSRRGGATKKVRSKTGQVVGKIEMYGQGRFFTITGETL